MNRELAKIFYEIADFLEMEEVAFKPYAYQKAAQAIESLGEDISKIYKKGGLRGLEEIPGVGQSIAEKMEEYVKTGKIGYYRELKKKYPLNIEEIIAVEGLGPRTAGVLYEKLKIKSLVDLEKAARSGKIRRLAGFGEKTEENILKGIEFLKRSKGRFLLGEILPRARELKEKLESLKEVKRADMAGSVRRRKETIGDLDFLVISENPKKVMDFFCSFPEIVKIWGKGETKASVRTREGFDIDIRVVRPEVYGSALQYFTGSKEHNIKVRKIAIEKGLKLNEYGLFRGKKIIAGKTEEEIYRALGMELMPPEIREDCGEIEAATRGKLPKLIGYGDIRGDLHCHSSWNGGENTIMEMAEEAMSMGYEYLGISDHTKFLKIEHGLDEKKLAAERKEIDRLNGGFARKGLKFRLLQGAETNVLKDGSIDIKDEALSKLDYAIAGIHSNFKMTKEEMTERMVRAMKNPYVKVIAHPTGRILKKRDEYQIDLGKVLRAAKEFKVALEINSFPERLDLNDKNIRRAKEAGVKMTIDTDSHHRSQMKNIEFGIATARRGWAEKKDILNTRPLEKLFEM